MADGADPAALRLLLAGVGRRGLGQCLGAASPACGTGIAALARSVPLEEEYARFDARNLRCVRSFVDEHCWDHALNKWTQGQCEPGEACLIGYSALEQACADAGGKLCGGHASFGIGGSSVTAEVPVCSPLQCSADDMHALTMCVSDNTCGLLPAEVISACTVDFGCFTESKVGLYWTFGVLFTLLLLLFLSILTWQLGIANKFCARCCSGSSAKRIRTVSTRSQRVENESQTGLLDGLGITLPASADSAGSSSSDLFSPLREGSGQEGYIVEGTPSILNTQSIPGLAQEGVDRRGRAGSGAAGRDAEEREGIARRQFKLSTQFERHIIKGFMFRRKELQNRGESGWGTGSTGASSLVWRSLFHKSKGNLILKGVSGYIKPGMCVACIGAPDSGATTLLKVLAGRMSGGRTTGEILLDGYPPSAKIKKILAYIPKEDLNLPTLTVRETLEFSLNMRSPRSMPDKLRHERVDVVLSLLGLSHVADTIVGDQLVRGISGGEKRRVSLGVELVVGRSLLLASQPTNGLDSSAAYDVIKATRALADTGLAAFMATVSQPSPELLALFDTVCMISRGTCVYFGPTMEAERFFFQQGFARPPSKAFSDYLEELTGNAEQFRREGLVEGEMEALDSGAAGRGHLVRRESIARQSLVEAFRRSEHYRELGLAMWNELDAAALVRERREAEQEFAEIHAGLSEADSGDEAPSLLRRISPTWLLDDDGQVYCCGPSAYTTGFWFQLRVCLARQVKLVLRSPTIRVRVGRAIFQGILIGSMFFQVDTDQQGANSRFGLLFLCVSSVVFGAMAVIPELFAQRQIYYAQHSAGYLRPIVYVVSLMLVEIPIVILETLINSTMVYSMCGLRNGIISWNYLFFWLTVSSMQFTSWTMCLMIIMASPSAVVAQAVCPTFIAIFSLFCGFLVPRNQLFKPMRWLWDVSPLSRAIKSLALNEVVGLSYHCTSDQELPPLHNPLLNVSAPDGFNGPSYRTCPLASGGASLYMYDYDSGEQDKWVLLLQNLVFPCVFTSILLLVMHTIHFEVDTSDSAGQLIASRKREMRRDSKRRKKMREAQSGDYHRLDDGHEANEAGSTHLAPIGEEVSPGLLPAISGCIEFHNLNYMVDLPRKRFESGKQKQLLFDVCGYAEPGRIVALMGPSGAGKSTLLDVLANKKTGGRTEAEVLLVNGRERQADFPRFAGYVEQMDSHLPTQTVREAIEASALLRLPGEMGPSKRAELVESIIKQLGLVPFQHNLIGAPANAPGIAGVSPEVRKKTTIAVELAMDPAILFLDEPTTGLDTASALAVMQAVRTACQNKATMCTIHQPSAEVFRLFDWMLLLQTGGRTAYFGSVQDMTGYFARHGFGEAPANANPADFALACTRAVVGGDTAADIFERSEECAAALADAPRHRVARGEHIAGYNEPSPYTSAYAAGFGTQFRQLLYTQFRFLLRDVALLKMRCSTAIFFGVIIGILFFNSQLDVAGAQARIALCFISVTYVGYSAILVIPQAVDQRPVHFRESTSNYYTLTPYFLAITVAEIPFILMQNFCYIFTFYFMVGLRTETDKFLMFCFGMFMLNLASFAFSSFVAAISPNADAGTIINTVANSVFTLFCGFLLPYKSIPIYWKPMYFISMFRYPLAFLISNELHGRDFTCPNHERAVPVFVGGSDPAAVPPPWGDGPFALRCPAKLVFSRNVTELLEDPHCFRYYCPVEDGDALLRQYNFPTDEAGQWESLSTMVGFYLLWRGCALLALKYVQHIKR